MLDSLSNYLSATNTECRMKGGGGVIGPKSAGKLQLQSFDESFYFLLRIFFFSERREIIST